MVEGSSNIALFGLIGALFGAIPGLLGVLFTWLKSRDVMTRALKRKELAKAEVEFVSSWLGAISQVAESEELERRKQLARERLDSLIQTTEAEFHEVAERPVHMEEAPVSKKRPYVLYIYTGFFFFMLFGSSIDDKGEVSGSHFISEMTSPDGIWVVIIFGVPWLILLVRHFLMRRKAGHFSIAN